jgi:hypothetical protein
MSTPVQKEEAVSSGAFNYLSFIQSGVDPRTGWRSQGASATVS